MQTKAGFSLWVAVTVAAIVVTPFGHANDNVMHVTVHNGYPGTAELLGGNYADAERTTKLMLNAAIRRGDFASEILELTNNLCAAELLQRKTAVVPKSCDQAVRRARKTLPAGLYSGRPTRKLRAVAYSNRGVSRALAKEQLQAVEDFNRALQLKPDMKSAVLNRDAVQLSPDVAMVGVGKAQR